MSCVNTKHPDFINLQEETNIPSHILTMKISKYMKDNNTDEFPSKEELLSNNNIKNGVKELFKSNPELANSVYEALGFETELPSVDNIIETENKQDKKEKLNKRRELVLKEINAIEELISTNPDEITIYETKDYEYDFNASHYFDKSNWELSNSKYKTSRVITKPSYLHSHLDEELQKRVKNLQIINSSLFDDVEKINYSNVFKEGKSYSSLEVLKYISNNKKDVLSEIAKTLIKYAEKNNVEIQILKREPKTPAGRYKVYQNKIEIFGKENTTSHTLIHEIIHSFSSRYIYENPKSSPVLQLENILKNILDKKILKEYSNFEGSYEDYATKNTRELLAEIISRPDILSHLALYDTNYNLITGAYKKETLLDKIIKTLSDIFNFSKNEIETLSDLILFNARDIFEASPLWSEFNRNQITPQQKQQAQQLYSQYLDTIFPDSKVKDIKQHATEADFESFTKEGSGRLGKGFYFSDFGNNYIEGENVKKKLVLLNIKNSLNIQGGQFMKDVYKLLDDRNQSSDDTDAKIQAQKDINNQYKQKADALIGDKNGVLNSEIKVFEPEQIHILGSKQDIEGFKDFVKESSKPKVSQITDEYGNTWNEVEIKPENNNDTILFQTDNYEERQKEKNIEQLDKYLLNLLKPFGVKSKEFEDLKQKIGKDALGVTDTLNKLIWYAKNRNSETIPEEISHMIVMLMGKQPIIESLIKDIHNWENYKDIYEEYMPIYNNELQVKIEAIGKLIAKRLVKNYKESKGLNKTLLEILEKKINEFFAKIVSIFNSSYYSVYLADKIAINVLLGNTDFIAEMTENGEVLNYNDAVSNNPLAQNIIKVFGDEFNNLLVGSLAIARQGEQIFRSNKEPIHDLDFIVNGYNEEKMKTMKSKLKELNAIPIHFGWTNKNKEYTTYAYLIPKKGYKTINVKRNNSGWIKDFNLIDEKGNILKTDIDKKTAIGVDFFVYDSPIDITNVNNSSSWNNIYNGKLTLSPLGNNERLFDRPKDQQDYIDAKPVNISYLSNPAFIYYSMSKKETNGESEAKNQEKEFDKEVKIFSSRYINVKSKLKEFKDKYPLLKFIVRESNDSFAIAIDYPNTFNQVEKNSNLPENREVNIRLKNLLSKIGITLEEVEDSLTINGEKVSGIAYADLFRKVIQYVNGKTDGTMLPEEAAHIFTLLMKKSDPLRNAMIKNIKSLQTYSDVRNNPKYQSKFGDNEDLYVMEAIGQVIMQRMMGIPVAKKEAWVQTWWNNLVNLVKTLLNGGVDAELSSLLKPFDEVKDKMLANETSDLMSLDEFAEENKNKQFQLFQVGNEVNPIENTINKLGEFTIVGDKAVDKDGKEYELADDLRVANKKLKFDILNQLRAIRGMSYEPITVDANKLASLDKIANELNDEITTIYGDDVTVITDQLYYDSETNKVKKVDLLLILPDGSVDVKMIEAVNENKKYGVSVKYYDKFNKNLTSIKKYLTRNSIISRSIKIQPIKIIVSKTKIKNNVAKSFDLGLDSYYLTNGIYYKNGIVISKDIYELNEADPMMVNTSHEENYTAPEINNENVEYSEFTTVDNPTKADTDIENKKNTKLIETLKYRLLTIEQSKLDSKVKAEAKKRVLLTISQLLTKNNYSSLINTTLADLRNIKKELKDMNPLDLRNSKDFVLFAKSLSSVHKLKDKINSSDLEAEDKKDYIHNINDINDLCDDILETIDSIIKVKNTQTSGIVGTNLESDADSLIGVNDIKDTNERNKLVKSSNLDFMMDWTDRMLATFRQNMSKNKWINTFIKLLDKQNNEILEENTKFANKLQEFKDKLGDSITQLINPKTKNLIRHFSEEFRLQSGIANKKRDWKWFIDNTTKKSNYKEIYDEMFEKEKNRLDSLNLTTDEYDYSLIKFRKLYDIDSDIYKKEAYLNVGTRMLFLDTKEEWYSDEYKALSPELKEFYTFWSTIMNRGAYILDERSNIKGNTIPNISKKLAETVFVDGKFDMKLMFAGLKFTGESKGRLNPITDEIEYTIPKYFIDSLLEKDGEEKSMDLYKSLMMFQAMVNNYEKKSEIEGQVLALQAGISDEKVLKKVNNQWLAIKDETNANLNTFMDYMNWAMYDVTNKNEDSKITGTELSTQKVIKGVKNLSVKANLSLNTFSIVANFLGNEYNIAIESAKGIAFTKKTWKDSQLMYANIFDRQEALGFLELLELDKKDELKKKINNLSINNIVKRYDNANSLFVQHFVENAGRNKIALAMALNHTVNEDGKIIRITEKTQKNLIKLGVINEKNEYNLNMDLKELNKFKRKVQHEIGIITGFSSEDDINAIKLSTMGDLVSTYRGWIPKMAAARFGDLKYNDVIDEWTIGRYKSMASYILNDKISNTLDTLLNVIPFVTTLKGDSYEARLIQYAKLDFVKQMQKNPKLTLEDEQAYIDAYVGNMKANLMELKVTLGILIMLLMMGGYDDDDKDKNRKYLIKIMKRSYSELSFFYNPFGFTDILKSPIPGTNYITNNLQMLKDVVLEVKGNLTDDEKLIKQAKPLHRFSKNIKYLSGAVNTIDSYIED